MGESRSGCTEVRVAVVGAGPQGLAAAALHLLAVDPTVHGDFVVVDPAGRWMQRWDERLARLEIDHLRSPGVHHPGCDPYQLGVWACEHELDSRLRYGLPATSTFQGYCAQLVADADLAEHVVPTKVRRIEPGRHRTVLVLGDGTRLPARHVVLAVEPARRRIPRWAFDALPVPPRRLEHADDIDLRGMDLQGEHIAVVGGGLTTGTQPDVAGDRLTSTLQDTHPTRLLGDGPCSNTTTFAGRAPTSMSSAAWRCSASARPPATSGAPGSARAASPARSSPSGLWITYQWMIS